MLIYTYEYIPKDVKVTTDQTYDIMDGSISYLYIVHDFEQRRLPIIKMHIELESETIEKLYKYKDTTGRITLTIIENQYNSDEEKISTRTYLNYMFSYIPAKDQSEYLTSNDIKTELIADEMSKYQTFECYLIDMTAVNWFTKQMSMNFRNASKPAILHALLELRNVTAGKVIATPPQDFNTIKNAIFPYGDLISNIMMLNHKYGIYSYNPTVYYDLHYLYCINRLNPNIFLTDRLDFAEVSILVRNATDPQRAAEGSNTDIETSTHYINLKMDPVITDVQQKKTSTRVATVTTVSKDGVVNKQTSSNGTRQYIGPTRSVVNNNNSDTSTAMAYAYAYNNLTQDQIINNNLAKGRTVSIVVNNVSLFIFRPYKRYTFDMDTQYENLDMNGKTFRLSGWGTVITRQGGRSQSAKYVHTTSVSLFEQTLT